MPVSQATKDYRDLWDPPVLRVWQDRWDHRGPGENPDFQDFQEPTEFPGLRGARVCREARETWAMPASRGPQASQDPAASREMTVPAGRRETRETRARLEQTARKATTGCRVMRGLRERKVAKE